MTPRWAFWFGPSGVRERLLKEFCISSIEWPINTSSLIELDGGAFLGCHRQYHCLHLVLRGGGERVTIAKRKRSWICSLCNTIPLNSIDRQQQTKKKKKKRQMSDLKSTWGSWDAEWINRECQTASESTHILLAIPPNQYCDRYLKSGHCFPAGASRDPEFACHTTSIKMPCLFFFFLFPRHENHYFDALTRLFQCLVKKK